MCVYTRAHARVTYVRKRSACVRVPAVEGAGETAERGGMRETFSSVPTARRLPPLPLPPRRSLALCRPYSRASGLVHLIPATVHAHTRRTHHTRRIRPLHVHAPYPSTENTSRPAEGGGEGSDAAAGPLEMLRASTAAISEPIGTRREGVLSGADPCSSGCTSRRLCVYACVSPGKRGEKRGGELRFSPFWTDKSRHLRFGRPFETVADRG